MDAELRDKLINTIDDRRFDTSYKGGLHEGNAYVVDLLLPVIQQEIAKARIDEIQRYDHMTYHSRDEFEAYIQQRRAELSETLKEHKEE